jgi:pyruvate/2-oxoglutarate dehydrogenase complex dihydrolipoamide acyltransferase (E2) component
MRVTLSVDHRIIDGVMAGTWLKHFTEALENPSILLLP